mmetsp:Transcript_41438/g.104494  ORF Transcript_41438/g.104494 Transcript_41438/m.104494 type:complete len:239 (+) Transcript_41438:246-962(+)
MSMVTFLPSTVAGSKPKRSYAALLYTCTTPLSSMTTPAMGKFSRNAFFFVTSSFTDDWPSPASFSTAVMMAILPHRWSVRCSDAGKVDPSLRLAVTSRSLMPMTRFSPVVTKRSTKLSCFAAMSSGISIFTFLPTTSARPYPNSFSAAVLKNSTVPFSLPMMQQSSRLSVMANCAFISGRTPSDASSSRSLRKRPMNQWRFFDLPSARESSKSIVRPSLCMPVTWRDEPMTRGSSVFR